MGCIIGVRAIVEKAEKNAKLLRKEGILNLAMPFIDKLMQPFLEELADITTTGFNLYDAFADHIASLISVISVDTWMAYACSYQIEMLQEVTLQEIRMLQHISSIIKSLVKEVNNPYKNLEQVSKLMDDRIYTILENAKQGRNLSDIYDLLEEGVSDLDSIIEILQMSDLGLTKTALNSISKAWQDGVDKLTNKVKGEQGSPIKKQDSSQVADSLIKGIYSQSIDTGDEYLKRWLLVPLVSTLDIYYYLMGVDLRDYSNALINSYENYKQAVASGDQDLIKKAKKEFTAKAKKSTTKTVKQVSTGVLPSVTLGITGKDWVKDFTGSVGDLSIFGAELRKSTAINILGVISDIWGNDATPPEVSLGTIPHKITKIETKYYTAGKDWEREEIKSSISKLQNQFRYNIIKAEITTLKDFSIKGQLDKETTINFKAEYLKVVNNLKKIQYPNEIKDPGFTYRIAGGVVVGLIEGYVIKSSYTTISELIDKRIAYLEKVYNAVRGIERYHNDSIEDLLNMLHDMGLDGLIDALLSGEIVTMAGNLSANEIVAGIAGIAGLASIIDDCLAKDERVKPEDNAAYKTIIKEGESLMNKIKQKKNDAIDKAMCIALAPAGLTSEQIKDYVFSKVQKNNNEDGAQALMDALGKVGKGVT